MARGNIFMIQINTTMRDPGLTIKEMAIKANMLVPLVSMKASGKTEWLMEMALSL